MRTVNLRRENLSDSVSVQETRTSLEAAHLSARQLLSRVAVRLAVRPRRRYHARRQSRLRQPAWQLHPLPSRRQQGVYPNLANSSTGSNVVCRNYIPPSGQSCGHRYERATFTKVSTGNQPKRAAASPAVASGASDPSSQCIAKRTSLFFGYS